MGKQTPEYKKKHQEQKPVLGMREAKQSLLTSTQKVWGATLTLEMKNDFKLNK